MGSLLLRTDNITGQQPVASINRYLRSFGVGLLQSPHRRPTEEADDARRCFCKPPRACLLRLATRMSELRTSSPRSVFRVVWPEVARSPDRIQSTSLDPGQPSSCLVRNQVGLRKGVIVAPAKAKSRGALRLCRPWIPGSRGCRKLAKSWIRLASSRRPLHGLPQDENFHNADDIPHGEERLIGRVSKQVIGAAAAWPVRCREQRGGAVAR